MSEAAGSRRARKASPQTGAARAEKSLALRLVKSGICAPKDQKAALKGLGFRRLGQRIVRPDHPAIRGMIHKVRHLVEVEVVKD